MVDTAQMRLCPPYGLLFDAIARAIRADAGVFVLVVGAKDKAARGFIGAPGLGVCGGCFCRWRGWWRGERLQPVVVARMSQRVARMRARCAISGTTGADQSRVSLRSPGLRLLHDFSMKKLAHSRACAYIVPS
jgi:hypothetical protein